MAVETILKEIEQDVIDVISTGFVHNNTECVPGPDDAGLTYERGVEKKGKLIKTCVLYVDIRDSVALTVKHHNITMGRIYTAFTKAVLKVARHHNGHTRNIIGDRVMIVFPCVNCFTNAVNCAISINHIAQKILNVKFTGVDFKCGIGIDYGELRVIKVGIQRHGTENGVNKGLVWAGYPANWASRLTDMAHKTIEETYYEVTRNPINPRAIKPVIDLIPLYNHLYLGALGRNTSSYDPNAPYYLSSIEKVEMTPEEFANSISSYEEGELYMSNGNFIKFERKTRKIEYPPILMTDEVFRGFKAANLERKCIKENYWKEQKHNIKNVSCKVYGGDVRWIINS